MGEGIALPVEGLNVVRLSLQLTLNMAYLCGHLGITDMLQDASCVHRACNEFVNTR